MIKNNQNVGIKYLFEKKDEFCSKNNQNVFPHFVVILNYPSKCLHLDKLNGNL